MNPSTEFLLHQVAIDWFEGTLEKCIKKNSGPSVIVIIFKEYFIENKKRSIQGYNGHASLSPLWADESIQHHWNKEKALGYCNWCLYLQLLCRFHVTHYNIDFYTFWLCGRFSKMCLRDVITKSVANYIQHPWNKINPLYTDLSTAGQDNKSRIPQQPLSSCSFIYFRLAVAVPITQSFTYKTSKEASS